MHYSALLAPFLLATAASAARVVPGATWTDTSGNVIQAHGAGILKVCLNIVWNQTWAMYIDRLLRSEARSTGSARTKRQIALYFTPYLAIPRPTS